MEAALGAAKWVVGKVLIKLSDDLVASYVASAELGLNSDQIKTDLEYTQGLLHAAQGRAVDDNEGLQRLLQRLSKKADEAEDALDELHYFILRDQIHGTQEVALEVNGAVRGAVLHGRHAARHTIGNWLPRFSSSASHKQDGDDSAAANTSTFKAESGGDDKLPFDRVGMSNTIKSVIQDMHKLCDPVTRLLNICSSLPTGTAATLRRPVTASTITGDELYGRGDIMEQTLHDMICGSYHAKTMSVLPIFGQGGIGKTTFTRYLYNHEKTIAHFSVRAWVCVSTNFDVVKLSQEILSCILEDHKKKSTNLDQLQKSITQGLKSKRFFIVLDDIWQCDHSEKEWKDLLSPFRNVETKGNMILVTTRFPSLARLMKTANDIELRGLERHDFLSFFEACVFGKDKPKNYEQELMDLATEIADKLKGSPLAANTVGRLLRKDHSREHWMKVLENKQWQNQKHNDDIMPSLKISYDYLPFILKKCFQYCALFPTDYRFDSREIIHFWIAIGIIDSCGHGDADYLEELVDNGFLIKEGDGWHKRYVMHDLLHELANIVASQECANIGSFRFSAHDIQPSIRHLSITLEDGYDINFEEEMGRLKRSIDVANLRTLMVTTKYYGRVARLLEDMLKETKRLRVLFFFVDSPQSLPHNFSKLIHLRFVKIKSPYGLYMSLPITLCRIYHLEFLDIEDWHADFVVPKDISHLVNLRHLLGKKQLHSNIPEVGKMRHLQELKKFCVKKKSVGFELAELGKLTELRGKLRICNLEKVATKKEASDANLMLKRSLEELKLVWGTEQQDSGSDVLDGLQPHHNLRSLKIINPPGTIIPSWLCDAICISNLKTLHLECVSWHTLPPFGLLPHLIELKLNSISRMRQFGPDFGGVTERSFKKLKTIVFQHMPELEEWVWDDNIHLFNELEKISCSDCPNLCAPRFLEFSNLSHLDIVDCPKLTLPPLPHMSTLTYVCVQENNEERLSIVKNELTIDGYGGALVFGNLDQIEVMVIKDVSHISLANIEMLKSLTRLTIKGCEGMFSRGLDDDVQLNSTKRLRLEEFDLTGKSSHSKLKNIDPIMLEEVLQIPSTISLRKLVLSGCKNLVLPMEEVGGLQNLTLLQSLKIEYCGSIFSRWSRGGPQYMKPFPDSLRELHINSEASMQSMALLSNLTSLTRLRLLDCADLTIDGFDPLMTVNLKELVVFNRWEGGSVAPDLLSEMARAQTMLPAGSFQLEVLEVDSISAVLVAPICTHLSATLRRLEFSYDHRAEGFSEEQEQALQHLTSLWSLEFIFCGSLQSLPEGLGHLGSLNSPEIQSLPKEGLPTSLREISVYGPAIADLKDQLSKLRETCPDIIVVHH